MGWRPGPLVGARALYRLLVPSLFATGTQIPFLQVHAENPNPSGHTRPFAGLTEHHTVDPFACLLLYASQPPAA